MNHSMNVDERLFVAVVAESKTMAEAAERLHMLFGTFKRHAKRLGVYRPNQGAKGTKKPKRDGIGKIPIQDILSGKYPTYPTSKLTKRLLKEGIRKHECQSCNGKEWLGNPIPLETHHIDGNRFNHVNSNLQLLCPNCHTFTDTYKGKNIQK